jgi:hypothetical protein
MNLVAEWLTPVQAHWIKNVREYIGLAILTLNLRYFGLEQKPLIQPTAMFRPNQPPGGSSECRSRNRRERHGKNGGLATQRHRLVRVTQ